MAAFEVTEQAEADVAEILEYTLATWGAAQCIEYADLIEEAFAAVAQSPGRGRARSRARSTILGYPIKQYGRNARHVVFYAYDIAKDRVTVLRVLHDSMDFDRNLP